MGRVGRNWGNALWDKGEKERKERVKADREADRYKRQRYMDTRVNIN